MDIDETPDFALIGLQRVRDLAGSLGASRKSRFCGKLAAELLIIEYDLEHAGLDSEQQLPNIWKLLRDVESICSWPSAPGGDFPLLRGVSQSDVRIRGQTTEKISASLRNLAMRGGKDAYAALACLSRFSKQRGIKKATVDESSTTDKRIPSEYPEKIKSLVYDVLCRHARCTCDHGVTEHHREKRHLARLMLRHSPPVDETGAHIDMLFSSAPFKDWSSFGIWQDVQFIIPLGENTKSREKRVQFAESGSNTDDYQLPINTCKIQVGDFCGLIGYETSARLCLTIQGGQLHQYPEGRHPECFVANSPSVSLAQVLRGYHLTHKMKAGLAYILALSVWHFYDSKWMNTLWTSQTIEFLWHYKYQHGKDKANLFATKPCFSVRFGESDRDACETNSTKGLIHRYPRVLMLGVMLVEIGKGEECSELKNIENSQAQALSFNKAYLWAHGHSEDDTAWPNFDYSTYRRAVKNCLDLHVFAPISTVHTNNPADGARERRETLFKEVVLPLEQFVHGTGWMEELNTMEPMQALSTESDITCHLRTHSITATSNPQTPLSYRTGLLLRDEQAHRRHKSREWMTNFKRLWLKLDLVSCRTRLKVAILDSGIDPAHLGLKNSRVLERKTFIEGQSDDVEAIDECGHGSHMAGIILNLTDNVDIYVGKVANSSKFDDMEPVKRAIAHARLVWDVDMISMSFGFDKPHAGIETEINECIHSGIAVFAAASNGGTDSDRLYPAKYEGVLCIHAGTAEGNKATFNPRPEPKKDNFMVLGDMVESSWPKHKSDGRIPDEYMSGTSVATPVAVCIAALLITYVREKIPRPIEFTEKARTPQGIRKMFDLIKLGIDEYEWVSPQRFFGAGKDIMTINGALIESLRS